MRDLGRTPEGDWLVQMTSDEHAGLARLAAAMEGKVGSDLYLGRPVPLETDQVATFALLYEFAANRMVVNELVEGVQDMVRLLSPEPGKVRESG